MPFLLDPASQRGVTRGHTAPRCGIHEKIRQECPPNPFLLRPTLDPASQRGVTCSHTAPDAESRKNSGRRARKIHSLLRSSLDSASQRGVTRSHTAPRCGIQEKLGQESPQDTFPFYVPLWPRVAARGDVLVIPHPDAVSRKSSGRRARKIHSFYVPLWPASQRGVTPGHTAP